MLSQHWLPFLTLATFVGVVFVPNMLQWRAPSDRAPTLKLAWARDRQKRFADNGEESHERVLWLKPEKLLHSFPDGSREAV